MVVATEELSWGSLGAGGSLITRPEILSRALVAGGTEAQKQRWLPALASGEEMCIRDRHLGVGGDAAPAGTVDRLEDHRSVTDGPPTASVLLGDRQPERPHLGQPADDLFGDVEVAPVDLFGPGPQPFLGEAVEGLPHLSLIHI